MLVGLLRDYARLPGQDLLRIRRVREKDREQASFLSAVIIQLLVQSAYWLSGQITAPLRVRAEREVDIQAERWPAFERQRLGLVNDPQMTRWEAVWASAELRRQHGIGRRPLVVLQASRAVVHGALALGLARKGQDSFERLAGTVWVVEPRRKRALR